MSKAKKGPDRNTKNKDLNMSNYTSPFKWVSFPEGRARFSGNFRGADERGHHTFAIELNGHEYFGEIAQRFLANNNDFNIAVVAFGYRSTMELGIPLPSATSAAFSRDEVELVRSLIVRLVRASLTLVNRPSIMVEYPQAHFMNEISFDSDWVVIKSVPGEGLPS